MATQRSGGFPVVGDRVLAEDGSTWLATESEIGGDPPVWVQQDPGQSVSELDAAEAAQKAATDRLSLDHRVYALAFGGVRTVKREKDLNDTDPKEQFVLALATSAMRDSIIEVGTGQRSDLEKQTLMHLRSFLGDPEIASAQSELDRLRRQVADDNAPDAVVAKARGPLQELSELAGKLPPESDARKTITTIAQSKQPRPELADQLFRELVTIGVSVETAKAAHGAASAVASAFA